MSGFFSSKKQTPTATAPEERRSMVQIRFRWISDSYPAELRNSLQEKTGLRLNVECFPGGGEDDTRIVEISFARPEGLRNHIPDIKKVYNEILNTNIRPDIWIGEQPLLEYTALLEEQLKSSSTG